jgi:hypothetical protein
MRDFRATDRGVAIFGGRCHDRALQDNRYLSSRGHQRLGTGVIIDLLAPLVP